MTSADTTFYRRVGKRLFDLVLLGISLPIVLPLGILVGFVVWAVLGRPVLFRQRRPGLLGRPFDLTKFRSMRDVRDPGGALRPDEERMTPFGRWLRRSSLDELPELWHILRGEMSFVGPRPLRMRYLERYSPQQARRHEALPGLTGWSQIQGRNTVSWGERLQQDVWYVDNVSWALDLRILYRTVFLVLSRKGIGAPGQATMSEFLGDPEEEVET